MFKRNSFSVGSSSILQFILRSDIILYRKNNLYRFEVLPIAARTLEQDFWSNSHQTSQAKQGQCLHGRRQKENQHGTKKEQLHKHFSHTFPCQTLFLCYGYLYLRVTAVSSIPSEATAASSSFRVWQFRPISSFHIPR